MGVTSMSRFLIYANLDTGLKDVTHTHTHPSEPKGASQVVLVVKNPPANAGDIRNSGLIPGLGRSPGEGNGYHSSILAWRTPWTEEPGGSIGSQRVGHNAVTACMHVCKASKYPGFRLLLISYKDP